MNEIQKDFDSTLSSQPNLVKSVSRLAAVQIMYQLSMTDASIEEVINHYEVLSSSKESGSIINDSYPKNAC